MLFGAGSLSNHNIYDSYRNSETGVLKNKKGINDAKLLAEAERDLTTARIKELMQNPIKGNLDFAHLQAIHKYVFQDIYKWAGETRNIDIWKQDYSGKTTDFCRTVNIDAFQKDIFSKLQKNVLNKDLTMEEFSTKAAEYLGEINALHPFREGNGRTQREFIRCVALHKGYVLDLDEKKIPKKRMIEASVKAMNFDYTELKKIIQENLTTILDKTLTPLEKSYQKHLTIYLSENPGKSITNMVDQIIAEKLFKEGYKDIEIINTIANHSPNAPNLSNDARNYAKHLVKNSEREIKQQLTKNKQTSRNNHSRAI